jgi:hypothetical protein
MTGRSWSISAQSSTESFSGSSLGVGTHLADDSESTISARNQIPATVAEQDERRDDEHGDRAGVRGGAQDRPSPVR